MMMMMRIIITNINMSIMISIVVIISIVSIASAHVWTPLTGVEGRLLSAAMARYTRALVPAGERRAKPRQLSDIALDALM